MFLFFIVISHKTRTTDGLFILLNINSHGQFHTSIFEFQFHNSEARRVKDNQIYKPLLKLHSDHQRPWKHLVTSLIHFSY